MICRTCNALMRYVMRFEADKSVQLYRCPVCYYESKATPLIFTNEKPRNKTIEKKKKPLKKKVRIRHR